MIDRAEQNNTEKTGTEKTSTVKFGVGDASYKMAGGLSGLQKLVAAFYGNMESLAEAKGIRAMHADDLAVSREKLVCFLSGWLGGPKLYGERFGSISIPTAHRHLAIGEKERDAWILCMQKAVDDQDYENSFKVYLIEQLNIPAERIRQACNA